ncbi:hypothetical protein DIPPA_07517 [Diplonema papillatum]|nr:hypothetical protein DIPPA_07517 [Diplonema papillatum]
MADDQRERDVKCLECGRIFRGVYPNRPSGRCACNGYAKGVRWAWCQADKEEASLNSSKRQQIVLTEEDEPGEHRVAREKLVDCPVCRHSVPVDPDVLVESAPHQLSCPKCSAELTVDAHHETRKTRNKKLWAASFASCCCQPPAFALPSAEFRGQLAAVASRCEALSGIWRLRTTPRLRGPTLGTASCDSRFVAWLFPAVRCQQDLAMPNHNSLP